MSPLGVGNSHSAHTLKTGEAKLWVFLVGVNHYNDPNLPSLRYPALDSQGLGEALAKATQGFPNKEVILHNDFAALSPNLETIRASLRKLVAQTRSQDTILLYFSGHGMLEQKTQQAFLCLADTQKDNLLTTGLALQELLQILSASSAHQQLLCLDTCHSGDMVLVGSRDAQSNWSPALNPTPQVLEVLRKRASQSKGFCALLSCDQGQKSWEFPELGHGVFTYYLMRGLLGEASDSQGVIEADALYKYVYRQTTRYIDKKNQQLRLINQQKLSRGEAQLHPEYPLQTPKRIVEGVGELILGFKTPTHAEVRPVRRGMVIDSLSHSKSSRSRVLSRVLRKAGGFELEYFPQNEKTWSDVKEAIQLCLRQSVTVGISLNNTQGIKQTVTTLLYLRGRIEESQDGESWLILGGEVKISRSWLRQELRRSSKNHQQIVILDCPGATCLEDWIEDLQLGSEQGLCLIAAAASPAEPEIFPQILFDTLAIADPNVGLPIAGWVGQLQPLVDEKGIPFHVWLSSAPGVIDILPGNAAPAFYEMENLENWEMETGILSGIPNYPTLKDRPSPSISQTPQIPKLPKPSVPEPVRSSDLNNTEPDSFLFVVSELQAQLEQLLIGLVGPIARTLLRKVLVKVTSPEELLEKLAQNVPPHQRTKFEEQAKSILQGYTVAPQTRSAVVNVPKPENQVVAADKKFLSQCEQDLAYFVGPIAAFLIKKTLKSQPQISPTELVNKLAEKIPDPQQAEEFKKRLAM
ncbi:MAG: caspase domain-containing protein [Scytonema sp. PMC 1069.18]|nr:caspase domain-containing protein [Scytonema sp. PMC 1069.18]MEC4885826.1 caspase domain-containing protein [Scytonema sp. PMC 1070.18]